MDGYLDYSKIIQKGDYDAVYRPNDDSYFLLKLILQDIDRSYKNNLIVEMGCGSGFVIGNIANKLIQNDHIFLALDINIDACIMTRKLSDYYQLGIEIINCNGFQGLNLSNKIDIFIFNPPYVPTEQYEILNAKKAVQQKQFKYLELFKQGFRGNELIQKLSEINLIDSSYAGGENGMEITWKILQEVVDKIKENGVIYLFLVAENDLKKIGEFFVQHQFVFTILGKQQKYNEHQIVLKFRKLIAPPHQ